jgi:hypothetical protein
MRLEEKERHTLVAFHDDPDLGSNALVDQFWNVC